jgi:hypothetical protein
VVNDTQVANPLFKGEDHGHDSLDESQFNAKCSLKTAKYITLLITKYDIINQVDCTLP